MAEADRRYIAPTRMDHIFNRVVAWLTRAGISVLGSRILRVRGRSSGAWRSTPVNLLTVCDQTYLVAPRGTTQWVRNIRVGGHPRAVLHPHSGMRVAGDAEASQQADDVDRHLAEAMRAVAADFGHSGQHPLIMVE